MWRSSFYLLCPCTFYFMWQNHVSSLSAWSVIPVRTSTRVQQFPCSRFPYSSCFYQISLSLEDKVQQSRYGPFQVTGTLNVTSSATGKDAQFCIVEFRLFLCFYQNNTAYVHLRPFFMRCPDLPLIGLLFIHVSITDLWSISEESACHHLYLQSFYLIKHIHRRFI